MAYIYILYIGRMDAEAETPILWPPDEKKSDLAAAAAAAMV